MLKGFKKTCGNGKMTSGIVKVLIAKSGTITASTMDATDPEAYKSLTMKAGEGFAKYEFLEDECEFQENYKSENGITSVEQKLIFKLPGMTPETRNAVEEIAAASACGLESAVVRKGKIQIVGHDEEFGSERPLRLNATTGTTGKKLTDAAGEEITLSRETTEKARYYVGEESALYPNSMAQGIVNDYDAVINTLAHSGCTLDERVEALEKALIAVLSGKTLIPELQVKTLGVWGDNNLVLTGTGAPGRTPDKAGQFYIDTTARSLYYSTGNAAVADWNNA